MEIDRRTSEIQTNSIGNFRIATDGKSVLERYRCTMNTWEKTRDHNFRSPLQFVSETIYSQRNPWKQKETWSKLTGTDTGTLENLVDFSGKVTPIDGIWMKTRKDRRTIRIYDRGRSSVIVFDTKKKQVINLHISIYSYADGITREKGLYATPGWRGVIGATYIMKNSWQVNGRTNQLIMTQNDLTSNGSGSWECCALPTDSPHQLAKK